MGPFYTTRQDAPAAMALPWSERLRRAIAVVVCLVALLLTAPAQEKQDVAPVTLDAPEPLGTFFRHSETAKWWISGQANFVFQAHGDFYAAYSGPNSFTNTGENANSRVMTLQTAYEFTPRTAVYLNIEEAGGGGLSTALGMAGFVNLDVVRNPTLGEAPYLGRLFIQQIIPLSSETVKSERTPLSLQTEMPVKSLSIRFGKSLCLIFLTTTSAERIVTTSS